MAEMSVYVECDHANCAARSRDVWENKGKGLLLTFCGHHGDRMWAVLSNQGFMPIDHDAKVPA